MNALDYTRDLVSFGSISATSNVDVTDHLERVLKRLDFETERKMSELMHAVRISATVLLVYLCISAPTRAVEPPKKPKDVPAPPEAHGIADLGMPDHIRLLMVLVKQEPNALTKALRAELHVEPGALGRVSKVMAAVDFDEQVRPITSNRADDADKAGEAAHKALEKWEEELLLTAPERKQWQALLGKGFDWKSVGTGD
jgi:hypothetical protein